RKHAARRIETREWCSPTASTNWASRRPRQILRAGPRSLGARGNAARARAHPTGPRCIARAEPRLFMARFAAPRAYLFDAYGTLFDVHSVIEAARAITDDPAALSALWRQKQLEYTWLRSLMDRYEDFWRVTEDALLFALRRLGIAADEGRVHAL